MCVVCSMLIQPINWLPRIKLFKNSFVFKYISGLTFSWFVGLSGKTCNILCSTSNIIKNYTPISPEWLRASYMQYDNGQPTTNHLLSIAFAAAVVVVAAPF